MPSMIHFIDGEPAEPWLWEFGERWLRNQTMTFNDVFAKYKSDKFTLHSYGETYDSLLEKIRLSATTVLEIGIYEGESLKGWRDYFPNAKIIGIDNNRDYCRYDGDRIECHVVDCTKPQELRRWVDSAPLFDVVIDDGCHNQYVQTVVWALLFSRLKPGGMYVIEDVEDPSYAKAMEYWLGGQVFDLRNVKGRHDDILVAWHSMPH